jgi:hypothetical protein
VQCSSGVFSEALQWAERRVLHLRSLGVAPGQMPRGQLTSRMCRAVRYALRVVGTSRTRSSRSVGRDPMPARWSETRPSPTLEGRRPRRCSLARCRGHCP